MGKGTPDRYAVLGHPVGHSLSPRMHAANFEALGMAASYEAFDVMEEALASRLDEFHAAGYAGLNLTIPLKARALEQVHEASLRAQRLGGVNTIKMLPGGRMYGDNTDGFGFLTALAEKGLTTFSGLRVMILGCGGTGRALALTCAQAGASALLLANRTFSRAESVALAVRDAFPAVTVQSLDADRSAWALASRECDLIVHTTSQGLRVGESSLLPASAFRPGQWLFDAVYTARHTPVMMAALERGARTVNGLGMLLHQGAESFRIWTGREPDIEAMRAVLVGAT